MKIDEVIKLVDAGYTKDEISALMGGVDNVEPEIKEEAPEPAPEQKEQPVKPSPEPADPNAARYNELLEAMQKLTGAIQAGNILNSQNKEQPNLTAEDILAEVVAPKPKRKG